MYNYYNQMQIPYQNYQMPMQNQVARPSEIVRVNGKAGADAFSMLPNSKALLLDENLPIVWLCQTDGAGFKTVLGYEISPLKEEIPVDNYKLLEERIEALEVKVNESNSASNEPSKKSGK